jgi:hypothetical protein
MSKEVWGTGVGVSRRTHALAEDLREMPRSQERSEKVGKDRD